MIYAHFFCGKNDLRAFFVAKTIYALRPESFRALKFAIRKIQTFCASGLGIAIFEDACQCQIIWEQKSKLNAQ